ncbi:hypothetical protein PUN28_013193 [Cardiocondyla obscurior]|uniref:Uncharacterized protein n=1 Tax=Cardiocondyla obscurior TaxID=286306 RepID=A0AAW2F759_9HYME
MTRKHLFCDEESQGRGYRSINPASVASFSLAIAQHPNFYVVVERRKKKLRNSGSKKQRSRFLADTRALGTIKERPRIRYARLSIWVSFRFS